MTEQDDLFSKDNAGQKEVTERSAPADLTDSATEQGEDTSVFAELPEEPEEAFAKTAGDVAGVGIAGGEVRLVTTAKKTSNLPLALLLLFVVLVGAGYYFIAVVPSSETSLQSVTVSLPKKQPIPERVAQAVPIKEVSVEQPPIAAEPQPVAEKLPAAEPAAETKFSAVAAAGAEVEFTPAVIYSVLVGPFITKTTLNATIKQLRGLGFDPRQMPGRGLVAMTRLLEGVYPEARARQRLAVIKKQTGDAFMLPTDDKWAVYVGSFSDSERAAGYADQLAEKGIKVSRVTTDIEMSGKMLLAVQADQQTARQVAELIGRSGLKTQVVRK